LASEGCALSSGKAWHEPSCARRKSSGERLLDGQGLEYPAATRSNRADTARRGDWKSSYSKRPGPQAGALSPNDEDHRID
jgi:hypothetical protein